MASVKAYLGVSLGIVALLALPACSKKAEDDAAPAAATAETNAAAPAAAVAPAADNTDTLDGSKFASFTGDAAAGEKVFLNCKTCHSSEAGKNMVGPSLHSIQGRHSGEIPGFSYSAANKASGIVWSDEKLFQYLENPQRVIPGTKMTYTGVKDPQQRANLIAYLNTLK
ncbi:cytochrome c family protein [Sphingomonas sp. SUN039]|nr:cytochrome c family protein [Sphingomonas sp. SUN039]